MKTQSANELSFQQAVRLIRQHACDGTSLEELLGALGCSRSTLERQFLKNLGRTPGQEVARLRMEYAQQLLITTPLSVKSIAMRVGYQRLSNFGDFFRRHAGLSPRHYRKLYAAGNLAEKADTDSKSIYSQSRTSHVAPLKKEANTVVNSAFLIC
jgi:transcriptional regulator GlxA family with amidase domain